jgi:hypothetical protein
MNAIMPHRMRCSSRTVRRARRDSVGATALVFRCSASPALCAHAAALGPLNAYLVTVAPRASATPVGAFGQWLLADVTFRRCCGRDFAQPRWRCRQGSGVARRIIVVGGVAAAGSARHRQNSRLDQSPD